MNGVDLHAKIKHLEQEVEALKKLANASDQKSDKCTFVDESPKMVICAGVIFGDKRLSIVETKGRLLNNINKQLPPPRDLLTYFLLNIPQNERRTLFRQWVEHVHRHQPLEIVIPYVNREKTRISISLYSVISLENDGSKKVTISLLEIPTPPHSNHDFKDRVALLDALIYNMPFGFWAFDTNGMCYMQNKISACQWGNMVGKSAFQIIHANKQSPFPTSMEFNNLLAGDKIEFEQEYVDIKGNRLVFHSVVSPVIINEPRKGLFIFNIDISERKLFEKALLNSERKFRNIFNNSTDGILIHDFDGNIYDYNIEFQSISGCTHRNLLTNTNFFELCPTEQVANIRKEILKLSQVNEFFEMETEIVDAVGIPTPVEIKSRIIDYIDSRAVLTIVRNIAFRKRFEIKLLNTVVETEEKERERLAGDLHDEIGPLLSSMKMYLSLLKDTKEEEKKQYINLQVTDLVKQAITSIREVSNSLSPHILTNYGLVAAFQNTIDKTRDHISLNFTTNCSEMRFPGNYEIVFYRIFKELLNNTLKHANAKHVEISLNFKSNVLTLHYEDNGKGFDVSEQLSEKRQGLGLFNILSRVKAIDGDYKLDSKNGSGLMFELCAKLNINI